MSDCWIPDDENLTEHSPVYSQTSGRCGSRRGGGTGRAKGNWWCCEMSDSNDKGKFGVPENRGGRNFRENASDGGNVDVVETYSVSRFTVKSADVGKIIGKGGCKIREFEEESGAHIQVYDT